MGHTFYEFRELTTVDELRRVFELRYRLYRASRLKDFVEENEHGVDLDSYETYGRHMGLFKNCQGVSTLVGFHRPIFPSPSPFQSQVLNAAVGYLGIGHVVLERPAHSLPIIAYWPDPEPLLKFLDEAASRGEGVAEATKFAIEPAESSFGLARYVIDAEHAIQFYCNGAEYSVMGIASSHYAMYRRYGYEAIPGAGECQLHGLNAIPVFLGRKSISSSVRSKLIRMAVAYMETGRVCYDPLQPECFYAPLHRSRHFAGAFAAVA